MLSAFTRGGVPVLKRRSGSPSFLSASVSVSEACIPSGPLSRTHSPTMVRPSKNVPEQRMTALTA